MNISTDGPNVKCVNPYNEGVPAPHLSDSAPPCKCSINDPNELNFFV